MVVDGVVVIGTTVVVVIATICVIIIVVVVLLLSLLLLSSSSSLSSLSLLSSLSSCSFCQCLNQIYEKIPKDLKLNPATKRFYCFFQKSAFVPVLLLSHGEENVPRLRSKVERAILTSGIADQLPGLRPKRSHLYG